MKCPSDLDRVKPHLCAALDLQRVGWQRKTFTSRCPTSATACWIVSESLNVFRLPWTLKQLRSGKLHSAGLAFNTERPKGECQGEEIEMFGFFNRKKPVNQIDAALNSDDRTYTQFVKEIFLDEMDPATRAHTLVAYMNLGPILTAMQVKFSGGLCPGTEMAIKWSCRGTCGARPQTENSTRLPWTLKQLRSGKLHSAGLAFNTERPKGECQGEEIEMFGFFNRKKPVNQIDAALNSDDRTYTQFVKEIFLDEMDPATRAHTLVAYMNLGPILTAMQVIIARKTGKTYTLEEFISGCWDHQENAEDEINSRRWAWLLYASLLMRLEKLARDNSETAEIGAQIWCSIAQDAPISAVSDTDGDAGDNRAQDG